MNFVLFIKYTLNEGDQLQFFNMASMVSRKIGNIKGTWY
jgi:hypothetical protein